jgi:hypothetical protein
MIDYIKKSQKHMNMDSPYTDIKVLLFITLIKNTDINKKLNKLIIDNKLKDVKDTLEFLDDKKNKIKKIALDIILKTNPHYLSPEALTYMYDLFGLINFDNIKIFEIRNVLLKDYEKYYKDYTSNNIIKLEDQINEYRKVTKDGPSLLQLEQNKLLESLYSPIEEVGKFKDYMIKIEIYALGIVFMKLTKFIEDVTGEKIDDKYKKIFALMTLYDVRFRYNAYNTGYLINKL